MADEIGMQPLYGQSSNENTENAVAQDTIYERRLLNFSVIYLVPHVWV